MIIEIKQKFNELPKEIKAQFDYNPEVYVAEFGSDSWAEKTGIAEAIKKQQAAAERAAAPTHISSCHKLHQQFQHRLQQRQ